VLDLGSGHGARLLELLTARQDLAGVGVDLSLPDGLARTTRDSGVGDRVTWEQALTATREHRQQWRAATGRPGLRHAGPARRRLRAGPRAVTTDVEPLLRDAGRQRTSFIRGAEVRTNPALS